MLLLTDPTTIIFLDPERLAKGIFKSHFFSSVRMSVRLSANFAKFNFFEKLNYGTHHMAIYGAQVNRK